MTRVGMRGRSGEPSGQVTPRAVGLEGPSILCGSPSGRKSSCHPCSRPVGLRVQGHPQLYHEFDHSLGHIRPYFQSKRTGQDKFSQPPGWNQEPGDFVHNLITTNGRHRLHSALEKHSRLELTQKLQLPPSSSLASSLSKNPGNVPFHAGNPQRRQAEARDGEAALGPALMRMFYTTIA